MKLLPLALFLCPVLSLCAADPAPQISERGKLLFSDDLKTFDTKAWTAAKGKWEAADGAVKGAEVPSDMHAGVIRHAQQIGDGIIQMDVKLDGGKSTTLSINATK